MADDQPVVEASMNVEASAPETAPSDGVSKRQRRPNVRLNEIGDGPLANVRVLEYFLKRSGGRALSAKPASAGSRRPFSAKRDPVRAVEHENGSNVDGSGEAGLARAPRTRPLNHLQKSISSPKGGAPLSVKARFSGPMNSPTKREGVMRNGFLSRKGKLGKRRHADRAMMVRSKRPGNARVRAYEEGSWRVAAAQKDIAGGPECNLKDAAGWEHRSSGSDHRVKGLQRDSLREMSEEFRVNEAGSSSFESESQGGFQDAHETAVNHVGNKTAAAKVDSISKGRDAENEEPSNSDLQELLMQVPLWERGIAPLENKVRDWLQDLGLEKYSFLFQLHEVGSDVLPLLTMEDLKEIGITAVGARRKLFSEIRKLRQGLMLVDDSSLDEK